MKLAEALIERADLQKQIAQAESRMKENAKVQEGDETAEATICFFSHLASVSVLVSIGIILFLL